MPASSSSFLVQSANGDFDLVVPRAGGGLDHFYRDNSHPRLPWLGPTLLFGSHDDISGASLIQSSIGGDHHFHALYVEAGCLTHDWGKRVNATNEPTPPIWHGPTCLPHGEEAAGTPALIETDGGVLHVVTPLAAGGLGYWTGTGRETADSTDLAHPPIVVDWAEPVTFGEGDCGSVGLVRSGFGNLEVVARLGEELVFYFQDAETGIWHGPFPFATGATGDICLVVSGAGNFELVAPLTGGGLGQWTRDNSAADFPWSGPLPFGEGKPDAAGFIQAGNFELVAREGSRLTHYWRAPETPGWHGPFPVNRTAAPEDPAAGRTQIAFRSGMAAIHAAMLHTGEALLFGFDHAGADGEHHDMGAEMPSSRVCSVGSGVVGTPESTPHVFCSGHSFLSDGRLVVVGGAGDHLRAVSTFDPATRRWTRVGTMERGRWYPTCASLRGSRVLIVSGTDFPSGETAPVNNTMQMLHPEGLGPEAPIPLPFSRHFSPERPEIDTYPFVLALPTGKVLVHSRIATRFYDPGTNAWDSTDLRTNYQFTRTYPGQGCATLLSLLPEDNYRARVLLVGGAGDDPDRLWYGVPATATAELLDLGEPQPAWRSTASMAFPRVMCDAVLLPDGKVLVVGGSSRGARLMGAHPVLEAELFDPATETWKTLCPIQVPRLYHATAMLCPDGRVFIGGKDGLYNPFPYHYPEHRIELYSPPYLFNGPRPRITAVPAEVGFGTEFMVACLDSALADRAVLMRTGSVTHSVNMDQRLVGLDILSRERRTVTLVGPPDSKVAPEGYYMLFLLSEEGTPSEARFVHLT
jgi:hypothetical protein